MRGGEWRAASTALPPSSLSLPAHQQVRVIFAHPRRLFGVHDVAVAEGAPQKVHLPVPQTVTNMQRIASPKLQRTILAWPEWISPCVPGMYPGGVSVRREMSSHATHLRDEREAKHFPQCRVGLRLAHVLAGHCRQIHIHTHAHTHTHAHAHTHTRARVSSGLIYTHSANTLLVYDRRTSLPPCLWTGVVGMCVRVCVYIGAWVRSVNVR